MDKKDILKNIFLFSSCPQAAEETDLSAAVRFLRGECVYGPERYQRALGIVLEGEVTARPVNGTGAVLNVIGEGGVFGAAALFTEENGYVSEVTASADSLILFLTEEKLLDLFFRYPVCAMNYIRFLTSRVRHLNARLDVFTGSSVSSRLYTHLCGARDSSGRADTGSMAALAKALGVGRTSLYRAMDELEEKGMIRRDKGEIFIL